MGEILCPFCGHEAESEYAIMYHLESLHAEGESPFVANSEEGASSQSKSNEDGPIKNLVEHVAIDYVDCPINSCGEAVLATELNSHLDMHTNANEGSDDEMEVVDNVDKDAIATLQGGISEADAPRNRTELHRSRTHGLTLKSHQDKSQDKSPIQPKDDRQESTKAAWKKLLNMPIQPTHSSSSKDDGSSGKRVRRLGKAELGPHANESQMPSWLRRLLEEKDGEVKRVKRPDRHGRIKDVNFSPNQTDGILQVIAQLLDQNPSTSYAYLCSSAVLHVSKLFREGGFCGYRNIQMLVSYIISTKSQGYPHFDGKIPSIFQIQEYIEHAWDLGINATGRVETGGIRGTRKYIGTPEAQAMFISLDIAASAQGVRPKDGHGADEMLCKIVEKYFEEGYAKNDDKVCKTSLPPLYFQHLGHSMTIIGFERKSDGRPNLIVFDPMFGDSSHVRKLIGRSFEEKNPKDQLKAYRRGSKYLRKYKEFELLKY